MKTQEKEPNWIEEWQKRCLEKLAGKEVILVISEDLRAALAFINYMKGSYQKHRCFPWTCWRSDSFPLMEDDQNIHIHLGKPYPICVDAPEIGENVVYLAGLFLFPHCTALDAASGSFGISRMSSFFVSSSIFRKLTLLKIESIKAIVYFPDGEDFSFFPPYDNGKSFHCFDLAAQRILENFPLDIDEIKSSVFFVMYRLLSKEYLQIRSDVMDYSCVMLDGARFPPSNREILTDTIYLNRPPEEPKQIYAHVAHYLERDEILLPNNHPEITQLPPWPENGEEQKITLPVELQQLIASTCDGTRQVSNSDLVSFINEMKSRFSRHKSQWSNPSLHKLFSEGNVLTSTFTEEDKGQRSHFIKALQGSTTIDCKASAACINLYHHVWPPHHFPHYTPREFAYNIWGKFEKLNNQLALTDRENIDTEYLHQVLQSVEELYYIPPQPVTEPTVNITDYLKK